MIFESKAEARKSALAIRNSITEDKANRDEKLICMILESDAYKNADKLLLFSAVNGEPDLQELAKTAIANGKIVAYPVCIDSGIMEFRTVSHLAQLKKGRYGILEPDENCPVLTEFENALCIVPGLCFSDDGSRLGYGGGYYDRFLEKHACVTAGVTYKELVFEHLPQELNDKKVDILFSS